MNTPTRLPTLAPALTKYPTNIPTLQQNIVANIQAVTQVKPTNSPVVAAKTRRVGMSLSVTEESIILDISTQSAILLAISLAQGISVDYITLDDATHTVETNVINIYTITSIQLIGIYATKTPESMKYIIANNTQAATESGEFNSYIQSAASTFNSQSLIGVILYDAYVFS